MYIIWRYISILLCGWGSEGRTWGGAGGSKRIIETCKGVAYLRSRSKDEFYRGYNNGTQTLIVSSAESNDFFSA